MANFLDENGVLYLWNKIKTALGGKVDKVTGKGLSTNDYTTAEKSKLSSIASGAEVNAQSDWTVTDTASDAFIKNKPTSMPASDVASWAKAQTKPTYTKSEVGLGNVDNVRQMKGLASGTTKGNVMIWGADGYTPADEGRYLAKSVPASAIFENMTGATASENGRAGYVPAPGVGKQYLFLRGDGTWQRPTNTEYDVFGGATETMAGRMGLVPAPEIGKHNSVLFGTGYFGEFFVKSVKSDSSFDFTLEANGGRGTFEIGTFHLGLANSETAGLFGPADRLKLNSIATGANKYVHPNTSGNKHIPSGGVAGQFLKWSADGTAVWAADNNTTYGPVTGSANGLMTSALFNKLNALPDNTTLGNTYAKKSDITNMYKYIGSVTDVSKLPTTGQKVGDVYNIEGASVYGGPGMNVAWNGTKWDPLGEIFTITSISNADLDAICV